MMCRGGGLDNMMIPMKTRDGKDVIPSVEGKYIQVSRPNTNLKIHVSN